VEHPPKKKKKKKKKGEEADLVGSLAAMRRFGRWLSRLRWREWGLVSISGEG
jgi:hypothetical protein